MKYFIKKANNIYVLPILYMKEQVFFVIMLLVINSSIEIENEINKNVVFSGSISIYARQ